MISTRLPIDSAARDLQAFCCGWILDGIATRARPDMVMTVGGGRIVDIFPATSGFGGLVPIDWRGFTILPPLIDAHVHLFLSGRCDPELRRRQLTLGLDEVFGEMEGRVRRHLRAGVLAVRDGGDHGALALALRDRYKNRLPRGFVLRASGRAWHRAGRYGRSFGRAPDPGQTLAEAVAGDTATVDQVKIIHSGINRLTDFRCPGNPQFDAADLKAAVAAAHRRGLPVMIHANGARPVAEALAAGCDSIEHGFFMGEENLLQMAAQGVVWVPTAGAMAGCCNCLLPDSPEAEGARRHLDHQLGQLRRARQLGVEVALGTDAGSLGVRHGRAMIIEMALMMDAGFAAGEVVQCGAIIGARLLNLERSGRLKTGELADFIVVPGPPEALPESLERVAAMYCNGQPAAL